MPVLHRFHVPQRVLIQRETTAGPPIEAVVTAIDDRGLSLYVDPGDYLPFDAGEPVAVGGGAADGYVEMPGHLYVTATKRLVQVVEMAGGLVRQRRSFWRLPLRPKDVAATISMEPGDPGTPLTITLHNVSGGGMLFTSRQRLGIGSTIRPEFHLDGVILRPSATIVSPADDAFVREDDTFGYQAMFMGIRERECDAIIRFVTSRQQAFIEQKKSPRRALSLRPLLANVIRATGKRSKTFVVKLVDLSTGGMLFATDQLLEPSDRVRMYFLPGGLDDIAPVLSVLCEVPGERSIQTPQYRGFFVEITAREQRHILKLIQHEQQLHAVPWDSDRHNLLRSAM